MQPSDEPYPPLGGDEGDDAEVIEAEVVEAEVVDADADEVFLDAEPAEAEVIDAEVVDGDVVDAEVLEDGGAELSRRRRKDLAKTSTALAPRDPMAAYMRDVSRYPVLSADEQRELAVKYVEDGDVEAARALVTTNLRLVVKIAYDYRQAYKNLLDLVQEGNIGLMQAVKKYDPYKGVKLSSYAAWWIRAYMLRFILNNFRLVKVGTTQAQRKLFFNLRKEKARLSAMGIEPSAEVIAERLGVTPAEVTSMDRRLSSGEASLDRPVGSDDGRQVARVELLASDNEAVDDVLATAQVGERLAAEVRRYGEGLTDKERAIFYERLLSEEPLTLQDLGDRFGVSRERIRQIEKRLLKKMRAHLTEQLGDTVREAFDE